MSDIIDTAGKRSESLPNAGGVLTLGILSIIFAGLIGLVLGIIGLSMAGKAIDAYNMDPERYTESSYNQVKSGKVCAIIGLCITGLALLIIILAVAAAA